MSIAPEHKIQFATVAEFEEWASENSSLNDKRFEFVDGKIIEKPAMKQEEFFIATFLLDLFVQTNAFQNKIGRLLPESDSHIDAKRKRIADLGYFTRQQIAEARLGKKCAPTFAIEILSPNEKWEDIEDKIKDYFEAGVQLVWYISPRNEQIYTYQSPTQIQVFKGTDVIDARPVLSDFSFQVQEMFAQE